MKKTNINIKTNKCLRNKEKELSFDSEDEGCTKARVDAGDTGNQEVNSNETVPFILEDVQLPTLAMFETTTTTFVDSMQESVVTTNIFKKGLLFWLLLQILACYLFVNQWQSVCHCCLIPGSEHPPASTRAFLHPSSW